MQADKQPFIFTFVGIKDHRGILSTPGTMPQGLRLLMGGIYLFVGMVFLLTGSLLLDGNSFHHSFFRAGVMFLLLAGFFLPLGLRILWLWRKLRTLTPLYTCSRQFGVTPECLHDIVVEHGILPQASVAGQDYFSLKDFGDISTLLRASVQPTASQETLLRPAVGTEEAHFEQLLRAAQE